MWLLKDEREFQLILCYLKQGTFASRALQLQHKPAELGRSSRWAGRRLEKWEGRGLWRHEGNAARVQAPPLVSSAHQTTPPARQAPPPAW